MDFLLLYGSLHLFPLFFQGLPGDSLFLGKNESLEAACLISEDLVHCNCPGSLRCQSLGTSSRRTQTETNTWILTKAVWFSDPYPRSRSVVSEIGETFVFSQLGFMYPETSCAL